MSQMIALDWGTTHARAALMDLDGNLLEERKAESGVGMLSAIGFADRFDELTQDWTANFAIACGMVGSRQGWLEAPYFECPAALQGLADQAVHIETQRCDLLIVPGLSVQREDGSCDVMRGEETQIAGLLTGKPGHSGVVVLPGTHSKWVRINEGEVDDFLSLMTGEIFDLFAHHSILHHTLHTEPNSAAFLDGVEMAKRVGGLVWSKLFALRANALVAQETVERDTLSGLLIGAEIVSARATGFDASSVDLIGGEALVDRYARALKVFGITAECHDGSDLVWPALAAMGRAIRQRKA